MNPNREELQKAISQRPFFSNENWKEPKDALQFSGVSWRPDFVSDDAVLCIIASEEIPAYLQRRIKAAAKAGRKVTCVADLEVLSRGENIELLSEVSASICYVSEDGEPREPKPLLKVLGEEQISVDATRRKRLVNDGLERCASAATSNDKGKRLEELVHFMFSQVADFRVLKCNWRTLTEELDCVIQIRSSTSERCWAGLGAPHIIVEAKNRQEKSGQENVSKLRSIMDGKRRTCRIGFLVSLSGFTSDATDQVLRFSTEQNIFVLLDKDHVRSWGESIDFDDALEALVTKAMLD